MRIIQTAKATIKEIIYICSQIKIYELHIEFKFIYVHLIRITL